MGMGVFNYILSATKLFTPSDGMPDIKYIPPDYKRKPAIEFRLKKIRLDGNSGLSNPISGDSVKDSDLAYSGTTSMNPSADDLVENTEILNKLSKIYGKIKERGQKFQYEERIDVDGDKNPDKVTFFLGEGSVTEGIKVTSGKRIMLEFEIGGWQKRIYGIVESNGEIKIAKRRWLNPDDAKKYLDVVLRYYEK